jgi:membrane fusion protein, copper/silver efflux system
MKSTGRNVCSVVLACGALVTATGCREKAGEPASHEGHATKTATDVPGAEHTGHDLPTGYAPVEVDESRQQLLGIKTIVVGQKPIEKIIRTVGIVATDETRTSHVHVKFDGFIEEVFVNYTGRTVKKGQPLLRIFSRDLLAAQQEYLASRSAARRTGAGADAAAAAAEQLVSAARERLRLFDVPEGLLRKIERTGVAERAITILAPHTGTVIEKQALAGLAVTPMAHLYVIADLSQVWVVADIYERDLAQVKVGQKANLRLDAMPGRAFEGAVTFVSPVVDQNTRTVKVRFEFANPDGALRPGMYATVEIKAGEGEGLVIPADSVIDTGERKIVFVARGKGRFEPRAVVTGVAVGDDYEVREGLAAGEAIAASGQFLLDSESRIRGARTGGGTPAHGGH